MMSKRLTRFNSLADFIIFDFVHVFCDGIEYLVIAFVSNGIKSALYSSIIIDIKTVFFHGR